MKKIWLFVSILTNVTDLYASWVETTLKAMTLKQKIAQLLMPGVRLNCPESIQAARDWVSQYHVGGLLLVNVGNNFLQLLKTTERATPAEQAELVKTFQVLTTLPLLISQDLEWGLGMRMKGALSFPHAMTLGALKDDELVYEVAKEIGRQARLVGVHINFAPVADVNNNAANPVIHDRSFGHDKELVARKAIAYMKGLHAAGIVSCAKHFPGHGDTDVDSHFALPRLAHSKERLHDIELYPFKELIRVGVPLVMTAHLHIPVLDNQENISATLSFAVITDLLKKELGFRGIVVTDSLGMRGITNHFTSAQAAVRAFLAGNDMLLDPEDPVQALEGICQAVVEGIIQEDEIDTRVRKILSLKHSLGLHDKASTIAYDHAQYVTPHAQSLKQTIYRHAITLVNDVEKLLPLNSRKQYAYIDGAAGHSFFKSLIEKNLNIQSYASNDIHEIAQDVVIIPLYNLNRNKKNNYGITQKIQDAVISLQQQGKHPLIVIFGTPYALELFPPTIPAIIAYEQDDDAQQAAADVCCGYLAARGVLPIMLA